MSSYDDDQYDDDLSYDDDYDDEVEDDDDDSGSSFRSSVRKSVNPFSTSGSGSSSSNLPGRDRAGGSSSFSGGSGANRPVSSGSREDLSSRLSRSTGGPSSGSSSSGSGSSSSSGSFFNRPSGSSGSGSSSSGSSSGSGSSGGSTSGSGPRTFGGSSSGSSSGSSGSSGSSPFSRSPGGGSGSSSSGSSGSSGSSPFSRTPGSGSGSSSGGSSSSSGSSGSSSPFRSGSSSSGSSPFGGSGSSSSGNSGSGSSPSSRPTSPSDRDKKDDKPADKSAGGGLGGRLGGGLGGITSRFGSSGDKGSSDKKDDKKDDKGGSSSGSLGARLGNLGGRFGGGDSSEKSTPARSTSSGSGSSGDSGSGIGARLGGGLGGITNRFGSGDKKDEKKSDAKPAGDSKLGGGLGGLTNRFRPSSEPTPAKPTGSSPSSSSRPGAGSSSSSSTTSSAGSASTSTGPRFGAASGLFNRAGSGSTSSADKPATPKSQTKNAAKAEGGNFFSSLTSRLPFGGGDAAKKSAAKPSSKTKASKVPQAAGEGMSLDTKLDILGVALVFGALLLLLSALSPQPGALTGQINTTISRFLGWGAIAVPLVMLAIGVWLILRHFGDEAPKIDPMRLAGVGLFYVALLITFQYAYSFDPIFQNNFNLYRQLSSKVIELGRGGGQVGWSLYELLVMNATEIGGMVITAGLFVISLMLVTRTSAAELAVIATSVVRSFQVSVQRRAQARAAARLEAEKATPLQPQTQISVTRPAVAELPPAPVTAALPVAANALPEPETMELPIEDRLTIRAGGQTLSNADAVPMTSPPAAAPTLPATARPAASAGDTSGRPRSLPIPGLFSRKTEGEGADTQETDKQGDSGGILGRFGRRSSVSGTADIPGAAAASAAGTVAAGMASASPSTQPPARTLNPFSRPTPSQPAQPAQPAAQAPAVSPSAPRSTPTSAPSSLPASPASVPPTSAPLPTTPDQAAASAALATSGTPAGGELSPDFYKPATPKGIFQTPAAGEDGKTGDQTASASPAAPTAQPASTEMPAASAVPSAGTPDPASTPAGTQPPTSPFGARNDRLNEIRQGGLAARSATGTASNGDGDRTADFGGPLKPRPFAPTGMKPTGMTPAGGTPTSSPVTPAASAPTPAAANGTSNDVTAAPASPMGSPSGTPQTSTPLTGTPTEAPKPATSEGVRVSAEGPAVAANPQINLPQAPTITSSTPKSRRTYNVPDYRSLLAPGSEQDFDREALVKRAKIIEETLQSFGAPGRVVEINTGPVITQFGVEPDYVTVRGGKKSRVKVSAIAQLDKDLQLSLGAKSVRIEAPVPGKGFVGVEVPNDQPATVSLRDVMESKEFNRIKSPLAIALGQSVDGAPVAADLTSMPHLLIAGTTGSGKSVCVNAIIASLVLRNTPDKLKLIMVDPKRVELTGYNGIPHLVAPVVVELERIVGVLKWVTREMDERYKRFSNAGARNIEDFNKHLHEGDETMPYIVVIIDELADLMMLAPEETERTITRIAALARATGIHLVIATQRPSVDVVTGLIKANFPARVAFAVASGIDSRVILDQPGAERLLGRGDMLYMSGDAPAPLRMQGVFVSDTEINNMVRYWRAQAAEDGIQRSPLSMTMEDESSSRAAVPTRAYGTMQVAPGGSSPAPRAASYTAPQAYWDDDDDEDDDTPLRPSSSTNGDSDEDELFDEAVEMVRRLGKASVSLLQRRLRIGYTRAARLIDVMEERGIVGPATEGSKPREVLK